METPGDLLEHLLRNTQSKLLIVSPFIKVNALKRLLSSVGDDVKVDCVTRWRLEEIIVGVSDLEIWGLFRTRPNASLSLRMNLHAKYYRGDESCLVGSANITHAALGWSLSPNLELLIPSPENQEFERELFAGTVEVTNALYDQFKVAVDNYPKISIPTSPTIKPGLPENITQTSSLKDQNIAVQPIPLETWFPLTRYPETLYSAYSGQLDKLSTAARQAAIADLAVLSIPTGLGEKTFNLLVSTLLIQMPAVYKIDCLIEEPQRFGAVRNLIRQITGVVRTEADTTWQTLMRWLLYFLPENYERKQPHHSEIFGKKA
ncbi:MAG: phospholipase D family protein [Anaerolineales bacterium]|nr:phospholipase D family protein [Anaerolineales bacterium]